jgi:hypothetical protein
MHSFTPQGVITMPIAIAPDLLKKIPFKIDPITPIKPWWPIFWNVCPQRILIVCDGGLDFSNTDFGLHEAVDNVLKVYVPGYRVPQITTAHRSGGVADIQNFSFTAAPPTPFKTFNFTNYDQLWMFGATAAALSNAELQAIANFMDAGGGVFATGDHESLGSAMCGRIPRVRSMRSWFNAAQQATENWAPVAPNGSNANRIDTLTPGDDNIFTFNDQSDAHPQRIHVRYFENLSTPLANDYQPHPLMQRQDGKPILHFPDHAHEGICVEPSNLGRNYQFTGAARPEYPSSGVSRPYVIATGFSGGGYVVGNGKPAVNPRCFGLVSAYDGHLVNVGRVACDSTWHHWLNINLDGTNSGGRTGFYVAGVRTPEYALEICQYFRNLVKWLAPTRIRLCHLVLQMIDLRFQYPLLEEWPVPPVPPVLPDLPELVRLGRLVADAGKTAGLPDFEIEAASALASLLGKNASLPLQALLTPWSSQDGDRGRELPVAELRLALLGAAMHTVWENTPESPADMSRLTVKTATALRDKLVKTLGKTMGQAVEHYAAGVKKRLDMSSKELTGIRSLLG